MMRITEYLDSEHFVRLVSEKYGLDTTIYILDKHFSCVLIGNLHQDRFVTYKYKEGEYIRKSTLTCGVKNISATINDVSHGGIDISNNSDHIVSFLRTIRLEKEFLILQLTP